MSTGTYTSFLGIRQVGTHTTQATCLPHTNCFLGAYPHTQEAIHRYTQAIGWSHVLRRRTHVRQATRYTKCHDFRLVTRSTKCPDFKSSKKKYLQFEYLFKFKKKGLFKSFFHFGTGLKTVFLDL